MSTLQIKNILTPTDFSETALLAIEHSAFMARLNKATLHLLHVIKIAEFTYTINNPTALANNLDDLESFCLKKMNEQAEILKIKYGIEVKTNISKGNPAEEIELAVVNLNIDIVVMGTHGTSGFNEYFIGSNAHKTIKRCPCPVLTVQVDSKKIGFHDIVLPVENTYHSLEKVNKTVDLARKYGAKIHLLGVIHENEPNSVKLFEVMIENVEKVFNHAQVSYNKTIVNADNLAAQTLNYAEQNNADLIVVLTDHESELNDSIFGTLAKQMVNHSKIPVLSIKPKEGKYTPYRPT
ncbi:MAG TPA: universal stress protein [Bacteroidia bacterium]|nr:universal stress protein [Bacteroidia bacterium]